MTTPKSDTDLYLACPAGKHLLTKHSLSESGVWAVFGEDPNCDWGGHHHNPLLGYFEGDLSDVIAHAVTLKGFWQWGTGGPISRVVPLRVP